MSDRALLFSQPARLADEARLALEDYARAAASRPGDTVEAEAILDEEGRVVGVRFSSASDPADHGRLTPEVEGFFLSLVEPGPDRLGYR